MTIISDDQRRKRLAELPGWADEGKAIRRRYDCTDFAGSVRFVNAVAEAAEAADHHPDLAISWNKVTAFLTSHDAGGVTERDLSLARTIDGIYAEQQRSSK